jgi:hypothetical protein
MMSEPDSEGWTLPSWEAGHPESHCREQSGSQAAAGELAELTTASWKHSAELYRLKTGFPSRRRDKCVHDVGREDVFLCY